MLIKHPFLTLIMLLGMIYSTPACHPHLSGGVTLSSTTTFMLNRPEGTADVARQQPSPKKEGLFDRIKQSIYSQIERYSKDPFVKKSLFYRFVPLFVVLMFAFIISIVTIMLVVLVVKLRRYRQNKKWQRIWHLYRHILIRYLTHNPEEEVPDFPGLNKATHKKVLIRQLYQLANDIYGRKQLKLQHVYETKKLHGFIIRKIRRGTSVERTLYLKYLSIRPFKTGPAQKLFKFVRIANPRVRLYSQLAFISQYPYQAFSFLEDYPYSLTEWEQLNLYASMLHNSIPIPELYHYLDASNPTVVIFTLRMIRWYYVMPKDRERLLQLIDHPGGQIRLEAYKTIVELNMKAVGDVFRYHYLNETTEVKKVMVDYFVKNKQLTREIYQPVLELETDPEMVFYLLEALYNQNYKSQQEVVAMRDETRDSTVYSMCQHIIENAY